MTMTKGEREDLQRLVRQREKVLKSAAKQRSTQLLDNFENQMGQEYAFDQDAVWEQAVKFADLQVNRMQKQIAARCKEMGIPERFAPSISLTWHHRGHDNLVAGRRRELRLMAESRVEAIEAKAITEIELGCLEAQTQIAMAGLTSEAAKQFVSALPSVEALMPALSFAAIAGEADPPVAEQLLSSNALRQQRYRDRQRALRDGGVTPQCIEPPQHNSDEEGEPEWPISS
jgi:hypothetical protein